MIQSFQEQVGAILAPYRAHRLYSPAIGRIHRVRWAEGETEALKLARRIAEAFEEVALRRALDRIQRRMEEPPGAAIEADCG